MFGYCRLYGRFIEDGYFVEYKKVNCKGKKCKVCKHFSKTKKENWRG